MIKEMAMAEFTAEQIMEAARFWGCSDEEGLRILEAEEAKWIVENEEE
jgi:hypothetical protein